MRFQCRIEKLFPVRNVEHNIANLFTPVIISRPSYPSLNYNPTSVNLFRYTMLCTIGAIDLTVFHNMYWYCDSPDPG